MKKKLFDEPLIPSKRRKNQVFRLLNIKPLILWLCCLALPAVVFAQDTKSEQSNVVRGTVKDEAGFTLPGATVVIKGTKRSALADANGKFELSDVPPQATLEISFLGFETLEIPLAGRSTVEAVLREAAKRLDEVVIIGSIERNRDSFTGSMTTVSGSNLKQIGTANLVESLKSLDPSFVVLENISAGANPNVLPTIEVRGQTSVINITEVDDMFRTDPNLPLFILDGFETTLQKIVDLDYNRVASVSILKDAASTAFYGSRAANGIVVVETVKGQPGRYKFFYNGDYSVQVPDLTSYNMMNAAEKLEFERLSKRYVYNEGKTSIQAEYQAQIQANLDMLYAQRLAEVKRGVNSYWLSEPLQTALINRQSVRFSGGNDELVLDAGFSYRNAPGVMKGATRNTWTGDLDITFNRGNFSFINQLGLSGYTAVESPYGGFQTWVNTQPYYRKTDENGEYPRYLDAVMSVTSLDKISNRVANPLYNAMLNSKNESTFMNIDERFRARWNFYKGMRLEGMFQLSTGSTNSIRFIPPEHTNFDDYAVKGSYAESTHKNISYVANLMYVWQNNIRKHNYILNARGEIAHSKSTNTGFYAVDFPYGTNGSLAFANSYPEGGRPSYGTSTYRRANFLLSLNYSYDNRYLFDLTYRLDGSTVFGAAQKFTPFWSTGIGWNLHGENFIKSALPWINNLRLYASIGQLGNQNLSSTISTSIYSYLPGGNLHGTGLGLTLLGNPNVKWQKTTNTNLALHLNMLDNRLVSRFEVYQKLTHDLNIPVNQPASTGVRMYPMNLGDLTYRGFEFEATYAFIRNAEKGINWRVKLMGATLRGKYSGFGDKLTTMNEAAQNSNLLARYKDGYGPKTLWAVRSLGIDPATGQELFLDRNNQPTFVYDANDVAAVGIGEAKVFGTISSFFTYKQITFTLVMRYSVGEDIFNHALYNKVENISFEQMTNNNQDRRALYDRWQKPGDIAQFKSISLTSTTPMSSRFVQTENVLTGESIGIMWRFDKNTWIRSLGLERLDLNLTSANIFRISNIKSERGTSFPFARMVSLSVNAVF